MISRMIKAILLIIDWTLVLTITYRILPNILLSMLPLYLEEIIAVQSTDSISVRYLTRKGKKTEFCENNYMYKSCQQKGGQTCS
jgi:hypothetical protein